MTARKSKPRFETDADGVTIDTTHPAEAEKDVVGEAKPSERTDAVTIAQTIADVLGSDLATANGNRVTITGTSPNGLIQTFYATVEAGVSEF